MATVAGITASAHGCSSSSSTWLLMNKDSIRRKRDSNKSFRVNCVSSTVSSDPYKTLRIHPGASESEVKKAFRKLALQYHPDVCRGSNCGVQFHQINEAYDAVMSSLKGEDEGGEVGMKMYGYDGVSEDEPMRGMCDPEWDMWEEWMGWEGAGIRDYSSHINPYI